MQWKIMQVLAFCCFYTRSRNCEKRLLPLSWLSVGRRETPRLPLDGFSRNLISECFSKLYMKTNIYFWSYLRIKPRRGMIMNRAGISKDWTAGGIKKSCEKIHTHIHFTFNSFSFTKNVLFWVRVKKKKYCTAGQNTDDNMAHAHYMLDTTHSEYVIFIAFPLLQYLTERASVLRSTYIACLVSR